MAATRKRTARKTRAAAPKGMTLYLPGEGGYSNVPGHANGAAYTVALLVVTGFAAMTKTGLLSPRKGGGNTKALKKGMGDSAYGYHVRKKSLRGNALTPEGVNFFNARLTGDASSWTTTKDLAKEMVSAVRSGGEVQITLPDGGNRKVKFDKPVTVE